MAVRPHNQQIGIELGDLGKQLVGYRRSRQFVPNYLRLRMQPMPPKMSDQVFGELYVSIFLGSTNKTVTAPDILNIGSASCTARLASRLPFQATSTFSPIRSEHRPAKGTTSAGLLQARDDILRGLQSGGVIRDALPENDEIGSLCPARNVGR